MSYDSLDTFLQDLPALANSVREELAGQNGLFLLKLPTRQVYIRLEDGAVSVQTECADYPNCIVQTDEEQVMELLSGRSTPMRALLFGKVRVQGDVKPLLRLSALMQ